MIPPDLDAAFNRALSGRRLLEHPYYQSWQDGVLKIEDLGAYAEQYRHVERCQPRVLAAALEDLGEGTARQLVEETLLDELSHPRPHLELFEVFASAVGASDEVEATQATRDLAALYDDAASTGAVAALSVLGAYEVQAAEVAATKAESLRAHYGLGPKDTEFWSVHADLERSHAAWTVQALAMLGASSTDVEQLSRRSADAWWAFLDERVDVRST